MTDGSGHQAAGPAASGAQMLTFHVDRSHLLALARQHRDGYRRARPFPHVVIDDFLPPAIVRAVADEFPDPGSDGWTRYQNRREHKLEGTDPELMGETTRHVLAELNSGAFVDFLDELTGIEGLVPDPWFHGGGMHQIERGGFLKVHADFNWHERLRLDRRINLLLYLNENWADEWGGHLELWSRDMRACERRIAPVFNRCVIFNTTDDANHGHPEPLACPPDRARRSLALYYYSNGRPASEVRRQHGTAFAPRPGEVWRRDTPDARAIGKRLLPPLLVDAYRSARARLRAGDRRVRRAKR